MTFLPSLDVLAAYTAAALLLILTPGPDMTLFLGKTLSSGRARGFAALLGTSAGLLVHTVLVAFGLSALLVASATAFSVLKIVGALYLLWLAIGVLRRGSAVTIKVERDAPQSWGRAFLTGLTINILNPKIVVFFLTFLPQFVSTSDPHAGEKLLFLGLLYAAIGLPICAVLILMAERFTDALRRSPRAMRIIDYLFAGLMGAFAVRLLFARAG